MCNRRDLFEQYIQSLNASGCYHINRVPENYPNIELRGEYISSHVANLWDMWNGMMDFVGK